MQYSQSFSAFPGIEVRVFRILTYTAFIGLVMFPVFLALLDYFSWRWHLHSCFWTYIYLDMERKEKATQFCIESITDT